MAVYRTILKFSSTQPSCTSNICTAPSTEASQAGHGFNWLLRHSKAANQLRGPDEAGLEKMVRAQGEGEISA
ncbi:hypothetical protein SKAU_G00273400 [Synaphobranchus kaupii]|uniref:Uncharacterized protein n=1 Tax=Synaphobranchus kaupii TaxID=118154 RepID=A0A9Q1IQT8_SYNKA|nr:hypothetical protein SKAU_G00273400 [Synaphobranchus kaupii]